MFLPKLMSNCSRCCADIVFSEQEKVVRCRFCQYPNQRPRAIGETLDKLKRGNRLLQQCRFEEAETCFQYVLLEYPDEPEALWGRLMCKYGVEVAKEEKYGTVHRYLLCHRARWSSFRNEGDFHVACEFADPVVREQYKKDAEYIDNVQQKIREAAERQESYDVFICYKETDLVTGERTEESRIAQRLYNRYTHDGYRVFFARETLCDKYGEDYEAAIYQAIATAKVMLVVGLKKEHFTAVWPKSEWMRYLERMEQGEGILIPVYGEMKAEELPDQFRYLGLQGCCIDTNFAYIDDIESMLYRVIHNSAPLPPQPQVRHEESHVEEKTDAPHKELPHPEDPAASIFLQVRSSENVQNAVTQDPCLMGITTISAGYYHTVGVKQSGTVVAVGKNDMGQCNVSDWGDIVAVSAGDYHTVGLKENGTIVAVGNNGMGQCNVSDWEDIVAVSAGYLHTVGLISDGMVVAVGKNDMGQCNVSDWEDIVAVSAGYLHTVGLKENGTVVAVGNNVHSQCNVSGWKDIIAVSAESIMTVGLKSDGTVVVASDDASYQRNVSGWRNIVAISSGTQHIVGLKSDGKVVAAGYNVDCRCNVSGWRNIVAVAAGDTYTVGLKSNGAVVAVGKSPFGESNVSGWTDIRVPLWAKNAEMVLEESAASHPEVPAVVSDELQEMTYPDGRYIGEIVNGKRHGKGTMYYSEEDEFNRVKYEGEYKDDKRHGKGVFTWKDGQKYDGEWKDDNRHGHGVYTWPNGTKYDGEWKDGMGTGQGVYYYANGDRYEGEFINGEFTGRGTLIKQNGERIPYKNGKRKWFF